MAKVQMSTDSASLTQVVDHILEKVLHITTKPNV